MKVFQQLTIFCDVLQEQQLFSRIEQNPPFGWLHDREDELGAGNDSHYFICTGAVVGIVAVVAVYRKSESSLYVSNVVARDISELSYDQYNMILRRFAADVIAPIADEIGIKYELSRDSKEIIDIIPSPIFEKLLRFSHGANKTTGSAHPSDRESWYDFIVSLHKAKIQLSSYYLSRWLIEEGKWDEAKANDLTIEFEFAIGLLDFQEKS